MCHIRPLRLFYCTLCGFLIPFHPGRSKFTPRSSIIISGVLTLSLIGPLLRPYITSSESFYSVCDEPVGRYDVGIESHYPTYRAPSPPREMWSVSSELWIDSTIIADGIQSRLLNSLLLVTVIRVAFKFHSKRLLSSLRLGTVIRVAFKKIPNGSCYGLQLLPPLLVQTESLLGKFLLDFVPYNDPPVS